MHNNMNVNVSGPVQPTSTYKTVVLKGNHSFASQVTEPNTKYVIKHDFVLDGDVTIPANCILEFDGGSLNGEYTITGQSTGIQAGLVKIFDTDIILAGTWNVSDIYSTWFGIDNSGNNDVTTIVNKIINFAHIIKCGHIVFGVGTYLVTSIDITRKEGLIIDGCGYASASVSHYKRPHTEFLVTGVNSVGFDLTDAKSVTLQNFTIKGDDRNNGANKPKTLILMSRSSYEENTNFNRITNIETDGHTSYYHLLINNAEINRFDNCVFSGYAKRAIVGLIYTNTEIISPFVGTEQVSDSMTCNNFHNCDILQYALAEDDFANPSCVYIEGGHLNTVFRDSYFRSVGYGNNYPHAFVLDENDAPIGGLIIENIRQENGNHGGMFIKTINNDEYVCTNNLSIKNCFVSNASNEGIFKLGAIKESIIENIYLMNASVDNNKCEIGSVLASIINIPYDSNITVQAAYFDTSIIYGHVENLASKFRIGENCLVLGANESQFCNYIYDKTNRLGKFKEDGEYILPHRIESANRPSLPSYLKGVCLFDIDINKPIYWNGSAWIDATGTPV